MAVHNDEAAPATGDAKVVLVTGASKGIGAAIATRFASAGYRVFGTSRSPSGSPGDGYEMLPLEITDPASIAACVETVAARTGGRIDVLINNVGTGILGAAEESSLEQVQKLFATNFFGGVSMTNAVLPLMRQRQSGVILFMSSAGGVTSIPYASFYCATKHAIEAYVEALRLEIEDFGIAAALIAPGTVSTTAGENAIQPDRPLDAYAQRRARCAAEFKDAISKGMDPAYVAEEVLRVIETGAKQPRYTVGAQSWGASLVKALMPATLLEAGVRRAVKD